MSVEMQVRLLRVIEEGRFMRVGHTDEMTTDVRLIAATNRDPERAVADGELREDPLYRISVFPLQLPPLRSRSDDVVLLANHFLSAHNRANKTDKRLTKRGERRLLAYRWPGNVRQLRNMIERAYILEDHRIDMLCLDALLPASDSDSDGDDSGAPGVTVMPPVVVEHGTPDGDRDPLTRTATRSSSRSAPASKTPSGC